MSVLNLSEQQDEAQVESFDDIVYKRQARRKKIALAIYTALVILLAIICILLWLLRERQSETAQLPSTQQTQDVPQKQETPTPPVQAEKDITADADIVVTLGENKVELRVEPSQRPKGSVTYQLVSNGVVLAQSERIKEGEKLEKMELLPNPTEILRPGSYKAVLLCIFRGEGNSIETTQQDVTLAVLD